MKLSALSLYLMMVVAFLSQPNALEGTVRRVKPDATGTPHDGSSWNQAYTDLQAAIDASSEDDEVWVASMSGTPYVPGSTRTSTFSLKHNVAVYGGFDGTESSRNDRDYVANVTILSGDVNGDDEPNFANRTDNCYHVVTAQGVGDRTRLDGFVIRDGYADQSGSIVGGGMVISGAGSSPRIFNCLFVNNTARRTNTNFGSGGAVYSFNTEGIIFFQNCRFSNNQAGQSGGAVSISGAERATFIACDFIANSTLTSNSNNLGGGALYFSGNFEDWRLQLADCSFEDNFTTDGNGGAIYCSGAIIEARGCDFVENVANKGSSRGQGGAIFLTRGGMTTLVDCRFLSNESKQNGSVFAGGGIAIINPDLPTVDDYRGPVNLVNCIFIGNLTDTQGHGGGLCHAHVQYGVALTNCLFSENSATYGGGAYCHRDEGQEIVTFTNCTIADNHAHENGSGKWGGIGMKISDSVAVHNSILWGNTDDNSGTDTSEEQIGPQNELGPAITYSCVGGDLYPGTGNINVDPLFVDPLPIDPLNRDYRLQPCSPASDAANYNVVPPDVFDVNDDMDTDEPTPDLDKQARAADNPFRSDDGAGTYEYTDMGAYELHVPACELFGDLEVDASVDGLDIAPFVNCVLGLSQDCTCADINRSGAADYDDIACFVRLLLYGTGCIDDCNIGLRSFPDCNGNGIHDANDLHNGTSADCNANGVPDECEIDAESAAPGGPYYCTDDCAADVNNNGVPDACEPDCNQNGIPDAWDISEETSNDVNENGIPDECELDCNTNGVPDDYDILTEASADCNGNGIPDECEYDCNENGVPDDCDVDPSDPDGDEWVSPDCNNNEYPDECELSLPPPFGSFDCNENGIPDECDIAECENDPACDDCNENGIPDECDIAAETSEDANTNGIPDECEGEMMMGGGESMRMSGGDEADSSFEDSFDEAAAWEVFYDWAYEQCWGGDCEESTAEQFRRMIDKKRELGLPLDRDW